MSENTPVSAVVPTDPFSKIVNAPHFVEVRFTGGDVVEKIALKEVPLSKIPALYANKLNPAEFVSIATGKDAKWVDSLEYDSAMDLYDALLSLHEKRFDRWEKSAKPQVERMMAQL